jgi:Fic family protein
VPASRAAKARARRPYNSAVPPVIAQVEVVLPAEVLAAIDEASQAIARFDAELGSEIASFAPILLRTESAASSRIENLTASARAIAEATLGYGTHNATLIVANQRAMTSAIALADRLDARAILDMHHALLGASAPDIAGRWRNEQVWIGGGHFSPHDADFVPPHHKRVNSAIDDLVEFLGRVDIPTLAHAAIAHAQLETIHPFADGNGRVGRALVHAQLRHAELTQNVTVPVSAGLLNNLESYFAALGAYRAGDIVPIVSLFADATFAALDNGRRLVYGIRHVRLSWADVVKARRGSSTWEVADALLRQPVVTAASLSKELNMSVTNVYRAIQPLVDAGVLIEFTNKKRNRVWRAPEVLTVLDAFAARAGRRQQPR